MYMYSQNVFSQIHLWLQNPEDTRDVLYIHVYTKS